MKSPFQKRFAVSAAATLKGKPAQTPRNRAFALGSGKTNTTNISMLDIIGPAHTVGITTDAALPLGAAKPSAFRIGYFFSTIEIGTVGLVCASAGACAARGRHVTYYGRGYECFIGFRSLFPFVFGTVRGFVFGGYIARAFTFLSNAM